MHKSTYTPATAIAHAHRHLMVKSRSGSTLAVIIFGVPGIIIGLASIMSGGNLIGLILAAILIGIAILCDPKKQLAAMCGACGNEVAPTSLLCPHCQTRLTAAPRKRDLGLIVIIGFLLLLAGFIVWLAYQ